MDRLATKRDFARVIFCIGNFYASALGRLPMEKILATGCLAPLLDANRPLKSHHL